MKRNTIVKLKKKSVQFKISQRRIYVHVQFNPFSIKTVSCETWQTGRAKEDGDDKKTRLIGAGKTHSVFGHWSGDELFIAGPRCILAHGKF